MEYNPATGNLTVSLFIMLIFSLIICVVLGLALKSSLDMEAYYEKLIKKEKDRIQKLSQRIAFLEEIVARRAHSPPKVVVVQQPLATVPTNSQVNTGSKMDWKDLEELLKTKNLNQKGARIMADTDKKGLLQEVGFFRMVMMAGLLATLVSMMSTSWERVKYRFIIKEDDCK